MFAQRWMAAAALAATIVVSILQGWPASAATATFTPVADTYVQQSTPADSFGSAKRIGADSEPVRRAFLKFGVSGLADPVVRAKLRLHIAAGTKAGGAFQAVNLGDWAEDITWDSQPAIDGVSLGSLGAVRRGQWAEVDVTNLVTGNGTFSMAITSSSPDGLLFDSRESGDNAPKLLVTTEAFSTDPVLVGAGDISSCFSEGDEETAKLLDVISGTVFSAGDAVYPDGSAEFFTSCFAPSWGRHRDRIKPVPGNHEYRDEGAAGYYEYFGAVAGEAGKGYYSYDLGTWHIVVLNSNCEYVSCAASEAQEQWLRADLAATASKCTLAFWHHPLFTSGANHTPTPEVLPLYQALYDFNGEAVVGGHNHQYERFAPQDPLGQLDEARGIRQFVAGMGGSNHYQFSTVAANSEVRNNDTFGVLKLTLHPESYSWEFVPVEGETFTDSGTTACH